MAKKSKRPVKKSRRQAAPEAEPAGMGKHPRRRRSGYSFGDHGASGGGLPADDKTIKPGSGVRLVRPVYKAQDSLIFRPVWCLDDAGTTIMPCRTDTDPNNFTDWIRSYPAVKYMGMGEEAYTFLLYDKADPTYERRSNPYVVLYKAVYNAVERDFTAPDMSWSRLLKGRQKALPSPTDLFYMQGLIFKQGNDLYVGQGKVPLGTSKDDDPQVVQLPRSAGQTLVTMLNEIDPEYVGSPKNFEKAMRFGDVTHPKFGRFIRIFPKGEGAEGANLQGLDSWEDGGGEEAQQPRRRGQQAGTTGGGGSQGGYDVAIDKTLVVAGNKTSISPQISPKMAKALQPKIVWWDDILHFPSHEEQCLMIAKGMRGARSVLEFAWQDHPEFFTADVQAVLKNAKQVLIGAAVPGEQDRDMGGEDWGGGDDFGGGKKKRKTKGGSVPVDADDDDYGDGYTDDEYDDLPEDEATAALADDEYEYEEEEGADVEEEEGDDEYEYEEEEDDESDEEEDGEDSEDDEEEEDDEYEDVPEAAEDDEYEEFEYEEEDDEDSEDDEEDDDSEYEDDDDDEESEDDDDDLEGGISDEEEEMMAAAEAAAQQRSAARSKSAKSAKSAKSSKPAKSAKSSKPKKPTKTSNPKKSVKKAPAKKASSKKPTKKGTKKKA